MKKIKLIIILLGLAFFAFMGYKWWDNRNFIEFGDNREYKLDIGDNLTIKLYANGATGYQNCWINEEKCSTVVLTDRKYKSSVNEKLGYIGAGGFEYWTLTSKTKGIDTLKITSCPAGPTQMTCNHFKEDSVKTDIQIILKVE